VEKKGKKQKIPERKKGREKRKIARLQRWDLLDEKIFCFSPEKKSTNTPRWGTPKPHQQKIPKAPGCAAASTLDINNERGRKETRITTGAGKKKLEVGVSKEKRDKNGEFDGQLAKGGGRSTARSLVRKKNGCFYGGGAFGKREGRGGAR